MNNHTKKMIAPILITCLLAAYILMYFLFIIKQPMGMFLKILIGVLPIAVLCASIAVLAERIKEIRSGEEDDLSQY